ncbi:MAG: hypothetical protein Q8M44_01920 [bacterium]|nr:hypothetical protein [bacterium]
MNNITRFAMKFVIPEISQIQLVKKSFKLLVIKNDICHMFSFNVVKILSTSRCNNKFFTNSGKLNQSIHLVLYISIELFIQLVSIFKNNANCFKNIGTIDNNSTTIVISINLAIIVIPIQSDIFHLLNLFNKGENKIFKNNHNQRIISRFDISYINKQQIIKNDNIISLVKKLYSFFLNLSIF